MKKALALLLVVVMALGMSTTAFAANGPIDKNGGPTTNWDSAFPYLKTGGADVNGGTFAPDDEIYIDIDQDMFVANTDPKYAYATDGTTSIAKTDISRSKVTLRTKMKKGSVCIDEVKFDYYKGDSGKSNGDTRILISMVDPFRCNDTDGIDWEVDIYFVIDGKAYSNDAITVNGTLENTVTDVESDTYYVYMADGAIADVQEYVREVEYELMSDGGVLLYGPAIKNAAYWGVAENEPTAAQQTIMDKYDIEECINLNVIGLDRIAKKVTLSIANPSDYVYDGNLKYLGRANADLPYASTYYLASKMLDVDTDEEPDDEDDDTDYPVAPPEGGGDGYPDNVNDNPGTGK